MATPVVQVNRQLYTTSRLGKFDSFATEVSVAKTYSIVRASLGAMTTKRDIEAFVSFLQNEFVFKKGAKPLLLGTSNELPIRETFPYMMRNVSDMESLVS